MDSNTSVAATEGSLFLGAPSRLRWIFKRSGTNAGHSSQSFAAFYWGHKLGRAEPRALQEFCDAMKYLGDSEFDQKLFPRK
jgi:hypothetical protein